MKLVFSDLHLKPESLEVCLEVLKAIRVECVDSGIEQVLCLGDFFHLRYTIPVSILNKVATEFSLWRAAGLLLDIVPGNHDQVDIEGSNALEIFGDFDGFTVHTEPAVCQNILYLPYRKDMEYLQSVISWGRTAGARYVAGHLPVRGAYMNNQIKDTEGVPGGAFRGFRRVLLGHYHKRQQFLNGVISYIGSPWQTRADEHGQSKGWVLWDPDDNSFKYVDKVFGKRYHRFTSGTNPDWVEKVPDGDQIKLVAKSEAEAKKWRKLFSGRDPETWAVNVDEAEVFKPRLGVSKGSTLTEFAMAYVATHGEDFDTGDLMRTFKELQE